jgi:hypothetical protein
LLVNSEMTSFSSRFTSATGIRSPCRTIASTARCRASAANCVVLKSVSSTSNSIALSLATAGDSRPGGNLISRRGAGNHDAADET